MLNRKLVFLAAAFLLVGCAATFVVEEEPSRPIIVQDDQPPGKATARLGVPPGHLPPPGQCRIWFPGRPPGHQPPPGRCSVLERELPASAWLLYRPRRNPEHIQVAVCHDRRPTVVVAVRLYEADSGRFVRNIDR